MFLKSVRSLTGMPVVDAESGARLGRVLRASVNAELTRLDGVWANVGWIRVRFYPSEAIRLIGDVAVLVADAEARKPRGSAFRMRRALNGAGRLLGAATDAFLDGETLKIEALEISRGFWEDIVSGRETVREFAVRLPDGDALVSEEGEKRNEKGTRQGNDRGRGDRRFGGDGLRNDELADGAEAGKSRDSGRESDFG